MPLAALRATLKDVSQSSDRRKPWNRAKASSKETPLRNSTFSAWNGTMLFIGAIAQLQSFIESSMM